MHDVGRMFCNLAVEMQSPHPMPRIVPFPVAASRWAVEGHVIACACWALCEAHAIVICVGIHAWTELMHGRNVLGARHLQKREGS